MSQWKKITKAHQSYLRYQLDRAGAAYVASASKKRIRESGDIAEVAIRTLLQKLIPSRFIVLGGVMLQAADKNQEPVLSDQIDIMIVDKNVEVRLFDFDETGALAVVPVESVVGLVEVKKTIDKSSLRTAIKHLGKTVNIMKIDKTDKSRYLPGGIQLR